MRVLLCGYYGFGNLGDEALLAVVVERLRARFPSMQIEVLSGTPRRTGERLGIEAAPRWDVRAVRRAIGRADAVLSGGGGLLQNATSLRSLLYYAAILRAAIRAKRKTMIFAQSIGPLDLLGRFVVRRFCRGLNRATVRDAASRRLLRELLPGTPVEQTADPVFLYDLPDAGVDLSAEGLGAENGSYALVSMRRTGGGRNAARLLARAVDRLAERHGIRSAFLPMGGAADAEISTEVIRACASAPVLLPECTLEKAAAIIRGAHVVIGMRLHALILAARFAVPFLALAYDPKVQALCDDLAYPLAPLWTAGREMPGEPAADELVDRLVCERDALREHLAARLGEVRACAQRNFDVLAELLEERATP